MINEGPSISRQATHGASDVRVYLYNLLDAAGLKKWRRDTLFHSEQYSVCYLDPYCRGPKLRR